MLFEDLVFLDTISGDVNVFEFTTHTSGQTIARLRLDQEEFDLFWIPLQPYILVLTLKFLGRPL